jgi:hypothetical protein
MQGSVGIQELGGIQPVCAPLVFAIAEFLCREHASAGG